MRNAWLSTAASAVMVVTLTIMSVSFIATMALNSTIHTIVNKIDVSIYLKDSTTLAQAQDLQLKLSQVNNVASVKYVSKQEALKRFQAQFKNNQKLLEGSTQGNLPASIEIKAKDPNNLTPIADFINQTGVQALIDASNYQGARRVTIDKIIKVSNFIKHTGLGASLIFVIISVMIIFNTIRMAIFSRREEIEIMQLIGATNWFIRGPFLCEASLYGVIAAVVSILLTYGLVHLSSTKIASYIDFASTSTF